MKVAFIGALDILSGNDVGSCAVFVIEPVSTPIPGKLTRLQKNENSVEGSIAELVSLYLAIVTSNRLALAGPPYLSIVDLNLLILNDMFYPCIVFLESA